MSQSRSASILVVVATLFVYYLGGYGVARWRKVLIRLEYQGATKGDLVMTEIAPGQDLRTTGVGAFKNRVAPIAATVFAPMRIAEAGYWNARWGD